MTNNKQKVNIFWFRRDLRVQDNRGLFYAFQDGLPVVPVFIFDTEILNELEDKEDRRVDFIHQALQNLNLLFKENGGRLFTYYNNPISAWQEISKNFNVHKVYTNNDYEPAAIKRDEKVAEFLHQKGIEYLSFKDQVIFEKDEILKADKTPYTVYTPYRKVWERQLNAKELAQFPSEKLLAKIFQTDFKPIHSLQSIGFIKTDYTFNAPQLEKEIIAKYDKTRDIPAVNGTSRLSVHLRFGTVSVRHLVRQALDLNDTWLSEMIWREFFMMILYQFPKVVEKPFRAKYEKMQWNDDHEAFERWCNGETGYPLVDAGMRELNVTGFMHNRVRMITASFLSKHLLIDWRIGEKYFATKLMDFDLSANNGNWQWAAGCGCDAAPYFRVFNPSTQAEKFDPKQEYIRKWIPELDTFKYAQPIVEHSFARKRALDTFAAL